MRTSALAVLVLALVAVPAKTYCQDVGSLFRPVPRPVGAMPLAGDNKVWKFRAEVAVPAFKIVESVRPDAEADVFLFASAGGGLSYQQLQYDAANQRYSTLFHFSFPTLLLSGNLTASENPIDLSLMASAGYGSFLVGIGYDLGQVQGRSRWFLGLSLAFANNN